MTKMNNFALSDEQTMILDSVTKLVEDVAAPQALHADEHREFVAASFEGLGELGLFGMAVSEQSGGAGLGLLALVVAVEACARACGSTARVLLTQGGMCATALDGVGAGRELLDEVMSGSVICSYVGPEHGIVAAEGAPAEVGQDVRLDGHAELVTGAGAAGVHLVAARRGGEVLLCSVAAEAVESESPASLGFRACAPARLRFVGATAHVLARGVEATSAIARAELAARIGGAALAVGSALGASEHARRHAAERVAFGKPLLQQQAVGHKLVESRRRAEAARHLTFHAARLADADLDAREAAMLARLTAIDAAVCAADEAIQIHGGYGYTVEYHVERHYRDAKTLDVLDGGAEVLRNALIPTA